MAEALIDSLSDEELDPGRYRDVHRETLHALIDAGDRAHRDPGCTARRRITRSVGRLAGQH